jgi:3-isopropylmalate/(R)-2-methylmalate dehydratase large subunit
VTAKTLFDKIWDAHEIRRDDEGQSLLWIDRHYVHEGSFHAFDKLAARGLSVAYPELVAAVADHYVPTVRTQGASHDPRIMRMVTQLESNASRHGIACVGLEHSDQGIVHVVGPELGLSQPGMTIVCGDSHTSTHGALGAIAFGIGASEVAHVLATQTLWQTRPATLRMRFEGRFGPGVTAKDVCLHWIAALGADGARGHAIEYAGSAIQAMPVEERLTLCNMSIEGGARCGLISPDALTVQWLQGRPGVPSGLAFERAAEHWLSLATDEGARFDAEVVFDASQVSPTVTWGTSPEEAVSIEGRVPRLEDVPASRRAQLMDSLDYMGLSPGQALAGLPVDRVFIGSCTNARLDDLRAAAAVLRGRRSQVPGFVSPGSMRVRRQAEAEGLHDIFLAAGLEWREPGCSLCVGMNGDLVAAGERCASTSNRNFKGRQGPGARTHLMSPAMVAAAAVAGHLVDVRELLEVA